MQGFTKNPCLTEKHVLPFCAKVKTESEKNLLPTRPRGRSDRRQRLVRRGWGESRKRASLLDKVSRNKSPLELRTEAGGSKVSIDKIIKQMTGQVLGIDISKQHMDVTWLSQAGQVHARFANTTAGIAQLLAWLRGQPVSELHGCMEATNIYWEEVAEALHQAGYTVSVVNPRRIKGFAMSQMRRNKTDKLDSEVIAAYCAALAPDAWQPPSETQRKLRALDRHRRDLKRTLQQQKNRRQSTKDADVKASLQRVIEGLEAELKEIEKQQAALTDQHAELRTQKELIVSIGGLGVKGAHLLMAELYDLARYADARAVAADAGVTPAHAESGSSKQRVRLSKMGKAAVRGELFMPAMNAMRTNPLLRAFAERLRQDNKPEPVIICAVIRKLLHIVYGVVKNNTPFDPNYGRGAAIA
jgi:transposase